MQRVLIANLDGLLSALPTVQEYAANDYQNDLDRFLVGKVEVADDVAASVRQEMGHVRVLMPGLPPPLDEPGWLYVAVVKGELVKV